MLGAGRNRQLLHHMIETSNGHSRQPQRLVVVGNGMASQSFCRWITERPDHRDRYRVQVIGEEPRPAYDRVNLTDYFSGKSAENLELASREWYAENGIELITDKRIADIDRQSKHAKTDTGEKFPYDKLVLATGSKPFVPPIPGVDLPGVHVYRTIEDVEAIAAQSQTSKSAVVMGGGLLGLEAAKALHDSGLIAHVLEMAPGLMPRQLDRDGSEELQRRIERLGVQIHLLKRTQAIEKHGEFLIVKFDTGETLSCDMVVISAGIRPRDELAVASGLKVGERGGIVVDDTLATADPSIFAIGECACHRGRVYGLVGPCYQMSTVLVDRLFGSKERLEGADQSAKLKLMGVDVATYGEPIGQAANVDIVSAPSDDGIRKLLLRDRRIVGALGVGEWPEGDRIRVAVSELRQPWAWQLRRFRKTGTLLGTNQDDNPMEWPPQALICSCLQVKRSDLTTACQQGCDTVEKLAAATGASTVCGSCQPLLAKLVGKSEQAVEAVAGASGLLVASLAALALVVAMYTIGPIPFSESVTSPRRDLDFLWRDDFWKQVSGYSLLAITVVSLLFSLRKRVKRISFGAFGTWRMAHATLGAVTLAGLLMHTGWHWGANLNFWLMACFVGVNLVGGFTGLLASMESRVKGETAVLVRQWRPRMTLIHILVFWPLPALIAIHIFSFYYY